MKNFLNSDQFFRETGVRAPAFMRRVDPLQFPRIAAKPGVPQKVPGVRKKLGLTQQEAGAIFGGGVNAFSRYERGLATPSVALVQLLDLLERHPGLLSEVRENKVADVYAASPAG